MSVNKWILIIWLALSALTLVGRIGTKREYTPWDGVFAVIECAAMIWLVISL